jgi:hypothetical protein
MCILWNPVHVEQYKDGPKGWSFSFPKEGVDDEEQLIIATHIQKQLALGKWLHCRASGDAMNLATIHVPGN